MRGKFAFVLSSYFFWNSDIDSRIDSASRIVCIAAITILILNLDQSKEDCLDIDKNIKKILEKEIGEKCPLDIIYRKMYIFYKIVILIIIIINLTREYI